MGKSFKIYTLGCKVNQYDSSALSRRLTAVGFSFVNNNADLAIINSCAVTKTAIRKSRSIINKARNENPRAKIVLTGCWPKAYPETKIKSLADLVCPLEKLDIIFIKKEIKKTKIIFNAKKARYFLKIQDGCEQFCSYCLIPYIRGKLKSRPLKEVITETKEATKAGYQEIVLSGIHLGQYGKDFKNKINLVFLLKKLLKLKELGRIRLSSIEVNEITDELIVLIAKNNKICPHLHIPLQSGSDKILKLMNRPYTKEQFTGIIKKLRQRMPNIGISTDVIVGFPGETKKDFKETEDFINKIKFSRLHIFPYSVHEKTLAAKFPQRVEEKEIASRAIKLRRTNLKLIKSFYRKFKNKKVEVLVEGTRDNNYFGKTAEYLDIKLPLVKIKRDKENYIGKIIKVKL